MAKGDSTTIFSVASTERVVAYKDSKARGVSPFHRVQLLATSTLWGQKWSPCSR